MNDEQKGRYATALNKLMAQAQEATFKEYENMMGGRTGSQMKQLMRQEVSGTPMQKHSIYSA